MPKFKKSKSSFYRTLRQDSLNVTSRATASTSKFNVRDDIVPIVAGSASQETAGVCDEATAITIPNSCEPLEVPFELLSNNDNTEIESENDSSEDPIILESDESTNEPACMSSQNESTDMPQQLQQWALSNKVNNMALSNLLKILKPHFPNLPLDARTLLKTPRNTLTRLMDPGEFYYFGIEKQFIKLLQRHYKTISKQIISCEILVNVDGLPISKSSGSQLYPILISLHDSDLVTVVGLYHGYEKPKDSNNLLKEFVEEAIGLSNNGVCFMNNIIPFKIKGFLCDAPAKSFVRYTKGHNAYNSCTKCCQEGSYINNRICFTDIEFIKRSDEDFLLLRHEEHHTGTSILTNLPNFGLVSSFPLDPMHLIFLGVMKKLLVALWCEGKPPYKLSSRNLSVMKPRGLNEVKRWKATEFRQFLLYTGPLVTKSSLEKKYYQHFMVLHTAVFILSSSELTEDKLVYAESLLEYFVKKFPVLYSVQYMSHNIHNLLHLTDDCRHFGNLNKFSAFQFENFLQVLKKLIRKSDKPLKQVINRISEIENVELRIPCLKNKHNQPRTHASGPLPNGYYNPQYIEHFFPNFTVKIISPDNCCGLANGNIINFENFVTSLKNEVRIVGRKFKNIGDFYEKPCPSSDLGVLEVSELDDNLEIWQLSEIKLNNIMVLAWHIVMFVEEERVEVFPKCWVINNNLGYWPNQKKASGILPLIKGCSMPEKDKWDVVRIRIIKKNKIYDDYAQASLAASKACYKTDVDESTECDENTKTPSSSKGRRIIYNKKYSQEDEAFDSDDIESSDSLESIPSKPLRGTYRAETRKDDNYHVIPANPIGLCLGPVVQSRFKQRLS
ncbi:unnamed protein product [Ceutorhynchus assimilis]|uniref:Transposase domain-containing protein n=1 Tax=Ceutorhynchus assimilis TaxID=467358 RepID=A0A9N9MKG1_9CUCU|nr:unnamed protein product [Ceutorhynchus assimilis]